MVQRIGVDVGGTNVKIALVSDEGKIIYSNSIPTHAEMGIRIVAQKGLAIFGITNLRKFAQQALLFQHVHQ